MLKPENIRLVERHDMEQVINMLQDISKYMPPQEALDGIWKEFSRQENVISIVVEIDGNVLGYGSLVIESKIRGGKLGHIEDIVVKKRYRSQGIGLLILKELQHIASERGCYKVALHCQDHNVPFYEKCGFLLQGNSLHRFVSKDH